MELGYQGARTGALSLERHLRPTRGSRGIGLGYFNEEVHAWGTLLSTGIMFQAYSGVVGSLVLDPPKPNSPGSPESTWRTLEEITFTTHSGLGARYTARVDYFAAVPEPVTWLTLGCASASPVRVCAVEGLRPFSFRAKS